MLKIPLLRSLYILSKKETMSSCSMCYPACLLAVCVPGWTLQVSVLAGVVCPAPGRCSSGWAMCSCSQEWGMEMCVGSAMGETLKIINNKSLRKGSASKQITACQVRGAEGCCHFFHPAAAWMLPFGQKADQKRGFSNSHLAEMNLESQLGKSWADIYLYVLAYTVFPCLSQDGGTYLGEDTWFWKFLQKNSSSSQLERPSTNLCFVFIIWGYVWNTLPGITSQLHGQGMWEIELHSLSHHPPFKKPCGLLGKEPKVIFLLHKSLLIYFPPLVAFQGLLQRKHELLRSD